MGEKELGGGSMWIAATGQWDCGLKAASSQSTQRGWATATWHFSVVPAARVHE
jgi:hypothetical protein